MSLFKKDSESRRMPARLVMHFREMATRASIRRTENGRRVVYVGPRGDLRERFLSFAERNTRGLQMGSCRFDDKYTGHRRTVRLKKEARKLARRVEGRRMMAALGEIESPIARAVATKRAGLGKRFLRKIYAAAVEVFGVGQTQPETAP